METLEDVMFLTFEALPLIIIAVVLIVIASPFILIGVGVHRLYKLFKRKPTNAIAAI